MKDIRLKSLVGRKVDVPDFGMGNVRWLETKVVKDHGKNVTVEHPADYSNPFKDKVVNTLKYKKIDIRLK